MRFLSFLESHSKGWGTSNGHIASPGQSPILCGSAVPARFKSFKPASYEVFHLFFVASYRFSNFSFFLLSFLALFPVIWVTGFLFPLSLLSSLGIVTSHYCGSFKGSESNTSSFSGVGALLSCIDRCYKSSCVLSTSTSKSLSSISSTGLLVLLVSVLLS